MFGSFENCGEVFIHLMFNFLDQKYENAMRRRFVENILHFV